MSTRDPAAIATAIAAGRKHLEQHPDDALGTDPVAHARLHDGLRVSVEGPHGWRVDTDMSTGVGGDGSAPSPGWMMRAALASCDAAVIAMQCAEEGISPTRLETEVTSESDDRGLLAAADVPPGPLRMLTTITLEAPGLSPAKAEELVERALRRSPVADAVRRAVTVDVALRQ